MFTSKFTINPTSDLLKKRGLEDHGRVQKFIDKEAIRIMTPYTPKENSDLIRSATKLTDIGSGIIRQGGAIAPYGRKWYYQKANFNGAPTRGTYWFKRSMQNGGKQAILKGVKNML